MLSDMAMTLNYPLRLILITILFISALAISQIDNIDIVVVSFLFLMFQSLFLSFLSSKNCSILSIYYVFSFIFFSFIPLIEYSRGVIYWTGLGFEPDSYLVLNFIIFVINFLYLFVYILFGSNSVGYKNFELESTFNIRLLFITSFVIILTKLWLYDFSLIDIFIRGYEGRIETIDDKLYSSFGMIMRSMVNYGPLILFYFYINQKKRNKYILFYLIAVIVFCVFPTGNPRFLVASVYIPLIIMIFPKVITGLRIQLILISGISFLFPFLENFRRWGQHSELKLNPNLSFFIQGHFDTYQSVLRVINENYILGPMQLIGNVLFFIPREIWSAKSVGSGYTMANDLGYRFDNIAMNYYGEGYVNGGYLGLFIFSIIFIFFIIKLDTAKSFSGQFFRVFMFGFLTMLLRGDFLTSFSQIISMTFFFHLYRRMLFR